MFQVLRAAFRREEDQPETMGVRLQLQVNYWWSAFCGWRLLAGEKVVLKSSPCRVAHEEMTVDLNRLNVSSSHKRSHSL